MVIGRILKAVSILFGRDRDAPVIDRLVAEGRIYLNPSVGWVWNKHKEP